MQNYLQQILTESNTIIIPGLGALTITSTKTGDIYFMPFLKHDDGTLAKYIAKVEGIELVDAKNTISNFVANIQSSLENGGNYEMEGFGRFLINKDGDYDFQRWEDYQIKDIAEIIDLVVKYDIKENLNLSTSDNLTIDQMARLALEATDSQHLKIQYDTTKPNGQFRKDIDTNKFKNLFPNYEFTSYVEGIKQTYNTLYGK